MGDVKRMIEVVEKDVEQLVEVKSIENIFDQFLLMFFIIK